MTAVLTSIGSVFSAVLSWLINGINEVIPIFWNAPTSDTTGSLTFLGVLAVCGLCISIFFLLMGIVQRFLHFGG